MRRMIMNKRGSEMIEAAFVLPLLLLATISIIYLGLFYHEVFSEQLDVQHAILSEADQNSQIPFQIITEGAVVSGESKGLYSAGFSKDYSQRIYIINAEILVRGEGAFESMFGKDE